MKVLLLYDVKNLGRQGETVDVKGGYARNYLLPKRLVTLPTKGSARQLALAKRRVAKQDAHFIAESEATKNSVLQLGAVRIAVRANEEGKLYGSITPGAVKELLKDKGIAIEARNIKLSQSVKTVGEYDVTLELYKDQASFKLIVEPEATQQESQPKPEGETNTNA